MIKFRAKSYRLQVNLNAPCLFTFSF